MTPKTSWDDATLQQTMLPPVRAGWVVADTAALLERLGGGVRDDVAQRALSVPCG